MDDVELVLRFFAYRQRLRHQKGALKDYLDRFLKQGNFLPQKVLVQYESLLTHTVKLVHDTLGDTAFWLWRRRSTGWSWFSRPTTVLYDPIMFVFSQHLERAQDLVARGPALREKLPSFYEQNYNAFEGRYTNLSNISERNTLFETFVQSALAAPV
jgi:hypothetical protein